VSQSSYVIYCNCRHFEIVPEEVKTAVSDGLVANGIGFEAVGDLCELSARGAPELLRWSKCDNLKIIACYRRTVKWLFHAGGAQLPDSAEVFNMRTSGAEDIISSLREIETEDKNRKDIKPEQESDWIPWFPVIDYDRCTDCRQCLNFCLFGVYAMGADERVHVVKLANCKTNCPACARVCPATAIIFPKYGQSPINGDQVDESSLRDGDIKVDLTEFLSSDIYDALRRRSKGQKRFAKDRDEQADSILQKKIDRLIKLRDKLDIPPDVLASLSGGDMGDSGE